MHKNSSPAQVASTSMKIAPRAQTASVHGNTQITTAKRPKTTDWNTKIPLIGD